MFRLLFSIFSKICKAIARFHIVSVLKCRIRWFRDENDIESEQYTYSSRADTGFGGINDVSI